MNESARSGHAAGATQALAWAGATHLLVLFATALLRPVRDAMGVASGAERLPWLFTATLALLVVLVPLHGWAARRLPRPRLVPAVWLLAALVLVGFRVALALAPASRGVAAAFFVAAAALNLAVVSSFWSQLADLVEVGAGRRLYGAVAGCGTAGALAGPAAAALLAPRLGAPALLLVAAAALTLATAAAVAQRRRAASAAGRTDADRRRETAPIGGTLWLGMRLAAGSPQLRQLGATIAAYALVTTYFYLTQSSLVASALAGDDERTAYFAKVDLAVNSAALALQLVVTPLVALRLGAAALLAGAPAVVALALPLTLGGGAGSLPLISLLYVVHRAGSFALFRPGRELLATRFALAERFQGKSFLDTVVYRTSDAAAAWLAAALGAFGGSVPTLAVALVAWTWAAIGYRLGRRFDDETRNAPTAVARLVVPADPA